MNLRLSILIIRLMGVALSCLVAASHAQEDPLVTPGAPLFYGAGAKPEGRIHYDIALIEAILMAQDIDLKKHPVVMKSAFTFARQKHELAKSRVHLVETAPYVDLGSQAQRIDMPLYMGLLGYRRGLIRKEQQVFFQQLNSLEELIKGARIGMGGWPDVDILKANNIPVITYGVWDELFGMLAHRRMDYLPLGVMEAPTALRNNVDEFPNLKVDDTLIFYYGFPRVFYSSNDHLTGVISKGFQSIINDGQHRALMEAHFADSMQFLRGSKAKIIVIPNPFLDEANALQKPILIKDYQDRLLPNTSTSTTHSPSS